MTKLEDYSRDHFVSGFPWRRTRCRALWCEHADYLLCRLLRR